jgi:hypothetical protein
MAPFTVSTRGVVLGGKAGSSLHSDLQELGRDDVKGALRVDASTNVKDTDLVFTTTDHTVRTVSVTMGEWAPPPGVQRGGDASARLAPFFCQRAKRRGRGREKKRKKETKRGHRPRRPPRGPWPLPRIVASCGAATA